MEEKEWKKKIAHFDNLVETSCVNEKASEELLFDILQDLFSEELKDSTRLQLLLLIQLYEDELVGDIDKAVQICGSLLNVYDFISNHLVLLKSQVLVTVTGICINYDLFNESASLYNDFIALLIEITIKVKSGHPMLRKTASDCLCVFENANPGLLFKYFQNVMTCLKDEKTFASYSHILVVASILYNAFLKSNSQNTFSIEGTNIDLNKSVSLLIKGMSSLSAAGLVYMLRKIIPCLHASKISRSVINNLLLYCMPSWDLSRVYIYIFFQRNYQFVFRSTDDVNITPAIAHLTMLLDMNQLTPVQVFIVQYWISEYVQTIHSSITYTEACLLTSQTLEPNIYTRLQYFPGKVDTLLQILRRNSSLIMSFEKQSTILRVLISHSKHMHWYDKMADLFFSLFSLYKFGSSNIQSDIIQVVEKLTVGSLKLALHTIDFCDHIEDLKLTNASLSLLTNIVKGLVSLETKDVISDLRSYFLILERAATVKEICPLHIIQSLKGVAKHLAQEGSNWQDGSLLLSICRNMIINYDEEKIRYEISSLLWYISNCFPSRYIHDRSTAYYLIIGKMSPNHYKEIFKSSFSNQPLKTESEVAEGMTQGPLLVRKLKKNFLSLKIKEQIVTDYDDDSFNGLEKHAIIESYHAAMTSNSFDKNITHTYLLSIDAEEPSNIYAIQLDLFTIGPFESESVSCPHLKNSFGCPNKEGEEIQISLKPKLPNVATFEIRATFIDEKHNSWITYLNPLSLQFKHLFRPLQYGENDRIQLFDALWSRLEDNENAPSRASSLSVKNIGLVSNERVLGHMKNFIVTQSDCSMNVGIYLSPTNHVLFKFRFNTIDTIVWIATDDVMLLDDVDNYLETLCD